MISDLDDEFLILTLHMNQHSLIHSMKWNGRRLQAQIMIGKRHKDGQRHQDDPSILYFCCTFNMLIVENL